MSATSRGDRPIIWGGLGLVAALSIGLALALDRSGYDVFAGGIVVTIILVVGVPATKKWAAAIGQPQLANLLFGALVTKMAFAVLRYFFIYGVYDGAGDAASYDQVGWRYAQLIRSGHLLPKLADYEGTSDSTRRLTKITGYVYAFVGHSQYAGFFIFSLGAFIGVALVARGLQIAVPEADPKRALIALLFFPSLLFWPASIGKDAVMVFLLGLTVLGGGMMLAPKTRIIGIVPFAAGLGGMLLIRPHVGLMAVMALAIAGAMSVVARSGATRTSVRARVLRVLLLVVLVLGSIVASSSVTRLFDDQAGQAVSTEDAFAETLRRTQTGNSAFQPVAVNSPASLPPAFVSVFFRPFPWEVKNLNTLLSGMESILLAGVLIASAQRLRSLRRLFLRRPFLIFTLSYVAMFTVAFANIGNFGILARQRTQALPLLLVLAALPKLSDLRPANRSGPHQSETTVPS